jgi:ubiquinone/menaquinone biosynthesis C-methylase UbiE
MFFKNNTFFIIFIALFLIILYYYFRSQKLYNEHQQIENFEDMMAIDDNYEDIYDKEFVDFYEIIYRDFSDIDYDLKIVKEKTIDNIKNKEQINILVCGCGVGKLCKKLKDNYDSVIGVDISQEMLKKAQYMYPNIKFIRGNISNSKLFSKNKFSHIFLDERTLYYNNLENIEKIIQNISLWINERGFIIIPVYNPEKLQLACRYYSSKYMDNKGNFHGFTYLNDFSHDCYYIRDQENKEVFNYYDKIILDNGKKRIKVTKFTIPSKEKIYDILFKSGFENYHIENVRIQIVGGYDLAIFRKKKTIFDINDLEKEN